MALPPKRGHRCPNKGLVPCVPAHTLSAVPPSLPPSDMDNYNELVKMVHGKEQALFF